MYVVFQLLGRIGSRDGLQDAIPKEVPLLGLQCHRMWHGKRNIKREQLRGSGRHVILRKFPEHTRILVRVIELDNRAR